MRVAEASEQYPVSDDIVDFNSESRIAEDAVCIQLPLFEG